VIFGNIVNILHVGPAARKVKIQMWGFLQLKQAKAKMALDKLLASPYLLYFVFSSRHVGPLCWRPVCNLTVNPEYVHCLHTNSSWLPIHYTDVYCESNQAKGAKRRQVDTAQAIASDLVSVIFLKADVEIRKTLSSLSQWGRPHAC
jgi:hypothetical protein